MMKPPFKASDIAIKCYVILGLIMHCVVCGFIKPYKYDFKVMKYISYVIVTRAISGL